MTALAALAALLIVFTHPPLGAPALFAALNVFLWRRRRAMVLAARAEAEERWHRELIALARYWR